MSTEYPWVYFVSYSHGNGFGSMSIARREALDPVSAHTTLRQEVASGQPFAVSQIVILNFQLMAWPDSCPSCGRAS